MIWIEREDRSSPGGNTVAGSRVSFKGPRSSAPLTAARLFTGIYGLSMVAFLGTPSLLLVLPGSLSPWPAHAMALLGLLIVGAAGLWLRTVGVRLKALAQTTGYAPPWTPTTVRALTTIGWGVAFTPYVLMSALSGYPIPPFSADTSNLIPCLVVLPAGLLSFVLCGKMAHARTLHRYRLLSERSTALDEGGIRSENPEPW